MAQLPAGHHHRCRTRSTAARCPVSRVPCPSSQRFRRNTGNVLANDPRGAATGGTRCTPSDVRGLRLNGGQRTQWRAVARHRVMRREAARLHRQRVCRLPRWSDPCRQTARPRVTWGQFVAVHEGPARHREEEGRSRSSLSSLYLLSPLSPLCPRRVPAPSGPHATPRNPVSMRVCGWFASVVPAVPVVFRVSVPAFSAGGWIRTSAGGAAAGTPTTGPALARAPVALSLVRA